jgi:hypothetical protein
MNQYSVVIHRLAAPDEEHGPFDTDESARAWARQHIPFGYLWGVAVKPLAPVPPPATPLPPVKAPTPFPRSVIKKPWWKVW